MITSGSHFVRLNTYVILELDRHPPELGVMFFVNDGSEEDTAVIAVSSCATVDGVYTAGTTLTLPEGAVGRVNFPEVQLNRFVKVSVTSGASVHLNWTMPESGVVYHWAQGPV
jgi:hypothetical protein